MYFHLCEAAAAFPWLDMVFECTKVAIVFFEVDLRCVFVPSALAFVQRCDRHENRTSSETRHRGRLETASLGSPL